MLIIKHLLFILYILIRELIKYVIIKHINLSTFLKYINKQNKTRHQFYKEFNLITILLVVKSNKN